MTQTNGQNAGGPNGKLVEIKDPFARRLIGRYLDNRKDDVDKLRQALAAADFETVRSTGHNLYGSGAAYGLDEISMLGAKIEMAAIDKDGGELERLIDEMTGFLRKLKVL